MSDLISNPTTPAAEEKKTTGVYLFAVFVGVPVLIIGIVVALFVLFAWMVGDKRGVNEYMTAIRADSPDRSEQGARGLFEYIQHNKRWQTLFDMTQQVSFNREQFLKENPGFSTEILTAFQDKKQDVKTRRYLALIVGLVNGREAVPALLDGLNDGDAVLQRNCLWVLGRVGGAAVIGDIAPFVSSTNPLVRLMAVFSIGSIESSEVLPFLKSALNDSEHIIRWNAALLLAGRGDDSGKAILIDLIKNEEMPPSVAGGVAGRRYVDVYGRMKMEDDPANPGLVAEDNKRACRVSAVQQLAKLDPQGSAELLKYVSLKDPVMAVRAAALKALNEMPPFI